MTNEKARDGQVAGDDQNTNGGEPIMTQNTTTPEHSATDVAATLALIDAAYAHCIDLEPSDALYRDIEPSITKSADWLGDDTDESTWVHMVYPIDSDGRKATLPEDWWSRRNATHDSGVIRYWQQHANSAIQVGDLLVISLGEYRQARRLEVNGQSVVEFVTLEEEKRRRDEAREAWTDANLAVILAAKPAQATSYDVWDFAAWSDSQGVMYEHEIGPVTIAWPANVQDGVVTTQALEVQVRVGGISEMIGSVDEMRELSAALLSAISVVEEAQA